MPSPLSVAELRRVLPPLIEASDYSVASLSREIGDKDYLRDFLAGRKATIKTEALLKIERLLHLPPGRLFYADGVTRDLNYTIKVVGRVGAGAEILMDIEQNDPDGLLEIESSLPVPVDAPAFQVEGDSMWPRYDHGDIVICGRQALDPSEIVNLEAAVRTADGRRFLKRIRRGSKTGLYDLESHNAAPIRDVKIEWVAEIAQVVRAGQWRRLDHAAQRKLIARMRKKSAS